MVYLKNQQTLELVNKLEFKVQTKLSEDNDWVKLSKLIPWSDFEEEYAENFAPKMGAPAKH
jgi:transposase, IS5 family